MKNGMLSIKEAAEIAGVSRCCMADWFHCKKFPNAVQDYKSLRIWIPPADLQAEINMQELRRKWWGKKK